MKGKIIILGASYTQVPLIVSAKNLNLETFVFAWKEGAVGSEIADHFYPISITEKEEILKEAKKINPDGILSIGSDLANVTVGYVANNLGLCTNSLDTIDLTTNKYQMRKILSENSLPVPSYKRIFEPIVPTGVEFPFMVKAVDRSGSRGITLVNNHIEFLSAFNDAISCSFVNYVLVEEYFIGTQYSVETFSQNGEHNLIGITEEFYSGPPFFVEEKHIMPGRLNPKLFDEIKMVVFKSLKVLGIKEGVAHSELRVNHHNQIVIIEIASRMGGDFRSKLVEVSSGIDFISLAIKNAIGERIRVPVPSRKKGAMIKWIITERDLEVFYSLRNEIPIIQSDMLLERVAPNVYDSSQRFGYYIFEGLNSQECLNVLDKFEKGNFK